MASICSIQTQIIRILW